MQKRQASSPCLSFPARAESGPLSPVARQFVSSPLKTSALHASNASGPLLETRGVTFTLEVWSEPADYQVREDLFPPFVISIPGDRIKVASLLELITRFLASKGMARRGSRTPYGDVLLDIEPRVECSAATHAEWQGLVFPKDGSVVKLVWCEYASQGAA